MSISKHFLLEVAVEVLKPEIEALFGLSGDGRLVTGLSWLD